MTMIMKIYGEARDTSDCESKGGYKSKFVEPSMDLDEGPKRKKLFQGNRAEAKKIDGASEHEKISQCCCCLATEKQGSHYERGKTEQET